MQSRPNILLRKLLGLSALLSSFVLFDFQVHAQAADEEAPPTLDEERPRIRDEEEEEVPVVVEEPEEPAGPSEPSQVFGTVGAGFSLRLVKNDTYRQQWAAPSYLDLFAAYVFKGTGRFRHGVGLGVSMNLSSDGDTLFGVDAAMQYAFSPSYLAQFQLLRDLTLSGKAGVPMGFTFQSVDDGGQTQTFLGFELGVGATYYVLAGFGPFVEISSSVFLGEDSILHPMVSAEVGVTLRYEVLP